MMIRNIFKYIPLIKKTPYAKNIINFNIEMLWDKYGLQEVKKIVETTELKKLGWGYILKENKDNNNKKK